MSREFELVAPETTPPLDPGFRPAVLANHAYLKAVEDSGDGVDVKIALTRGDGSVSVYATRMYGPDSESAGANLVYAERLVKFLLWQRGGYKVTIAGQQQVADHIKQVYAPDGERAFDHRFMGGVYEREFEVEGVALEDCPEEQDTTEPLGRHLEGCRVGFDLGASDRKTSAVIDGESVWEEEVPWDPRNQADWTYHYEGIKHSISSAMEHLPRTDAIGGSSAGVWINSRALVASLFRSIPEDDFEAHIKNIMLDIGREFGVPIVVVNDGEVTALAGSMSLEENGVLGVAMGSSEAVGFVTMDGNITGWLNELAFAPMDYQPDAPEDEWSGDRGVGALYFSQQAVGRLAPVAGIEFDDDPDLPILLERVQELHLEDDERAHRIFVTMGVYLGYTIAHYADFYDFENMLILGRCTSGNGGPTILETATDLLQREFPALAEKINLMLPSERLRRVGQAIAAASLPEINGGCCGGCCGQ
ncbi:MAG: ROK family protein [Armatimonadota bacterium]|jgi:predicted NBD/HSP70 family sugar kinase